MPAYCSLRMPQKTPGARAAKVLIRAFGVPEPSSRMAHVPVLPCSSAKRWTTKGRQQQWRTPTHVCTADERPFRKAAAHPSGMIGIRRMAELVEDEVPGFKPFAELTWYWYRRQ